MKKLILLLAVIFTTQTLYSIDDFNLYEYFIKEYVVMVGLPDSAVIKYWKLSGVEDIEYKYDSTGKIEWIVFNDINKADKGIYNFEYFLDDDNKIQFLLLVVNKEKGRNILNTLLNSKGKPKAYKRDNIYFGYLYEFDFCTFDISQRKTDGLFIISISNMMQKLEKIIQENVK